MPNIDGIITEDVASTIALDQTVYDNDGKKVGTVDNINRDTGYLIVAINPFSEKELYVPFRLITNIDPREMYLSLSKEELRRDFSDPPPRSTLVDRVDGRETAITTEPSGYDGVPIVVEQASIDRLKRRIAVGYHVYTMEMTDIGKIKRYDPVTGWMLVEKGPQFDKHDLMVPVTVVRNVGPDSHEVFLAVSRADLDRMQHLEPADVVFVQAEFKDGS